MDPRDFLTAAIETFMMIAVMTLILGLPFAPHWEAFR